jgi:hypothetical protein
VSADTIAVVDRLVERFDSLKPLAREHLADNFGEVLPHVFLGDVTRFLAARVAAPGYVPGGIEPEAKQILAMLAEEFSSGDEEVKELISVSVLENLPEGGVGRHLRAHLGPALSAELARMRQR